MNTLEAIYRGITVDLHPDDPGPTPPAWPDQEWCDGGTCEHPACLEQTSLEAAWRDDARLEGQETGR